MLCRSKDIHETKCSTSVFKGLRKPSKTKKNLKQLSPVLFKSYHKTKKKKNRYKFETQKSMFHLQILL